MSSFGAKVSQGEPRSVDQLGENCLVERFSDQVSIFFQTLETKLYTKAVLENFFEP